MKSLLGGENPISIIQRSLGTAEICTLPKSVCLSYRWAADEICNKYGRNVLVCVRWAESSDNISRRERERSGGEEVEPVWELFGQKKSGSTSLMKAGGME